MSQKLKVGFVGWRGMVGSVLMNRMQEEDDFSLFESYFFTTSQSGQQTPYSFAANKSLLDANDLQELAKMNVIVTCQGSDFTEKIYHDLRKQWHGHWIDAASLLRMEDESVIVLDPVNLADITQKLKNGNKTWIGGNCTVSLMLLAIQGLLKENLVEWVTSMTYQAASGAGANNMRELLVQMGYLESEVSDLLSNADSNILDIDTKIKNAFNNSDFPKKYFGESLAGNVIPWIDSDLQDGNSKEEWKGQVETLKILNTTYEKIKVDGLCVRVGTMRCHSQALTIKLKKDLDLNEIERLISEANEWVKFIPNHKQQTIEELLPSKVSGSLDIKVGRLKKLKVENNIISIFTIGDQLLWGAAEPLRRILRIILS
ncbi:MAG: aspartate-semialdehyde dehydrogenase [Nitrosomonadales bacterium]|jgi:aspartate-semialdehyde dehydrogenase